MRKTNYGLNIIEPNDQILDLPYQLNENTMTIIELIDGMKAELADLREKVKQVEEAREW